MPDSELEIFPSGPGIHSRELPAQLVVAARKILEDFDYATLLGVPETIIRRRLQSWLTEVKCERMRPRSIGLQ